MMLVLEPNGTLVMYCGMVKVCFADSIFCWIPRHLCTMFLIPNPNTRPACQDLFFSNQDLGRQASLPALTFNNNKNNYEETRHKPSQSS